MRISDWSSDVCSSDLSRPWSTAPENHAGYTIGTCVMSPPLRTAATRLSQIGQAGSGTREPAATSVSEISRCPAVAPRYCATIDPTDVPTRSEEHTSELQSLLRISYAVFCLKKNNK